MDYNQHMTEHRRLTILTVLSGAPDYSAHEHNLKTALQQKAEAVSTDRLRADLQWLHEQGLLYAKQADGYWYATLTAGGNDVRQGLASMPGVARPEPK